MQVVEEYRKEGFAFVLRVLNEPRHLEALTGLKELMERAEEADLEWDDSDDDDGGEDL